MSPPGVRMVPCPVCGLPMSPSSIYAHVGSARCLQTWQYGLKGKHFDPVVGPKALALSQQLSDILGASPAGMTVADSEEDGLNGTRGR